MGSGFTTTTKEASATRNSGYISAITHTLDGTDYRVHFNYDSLGRSDRVEYPDLGSGRKVTVRSHYDAASGALNGLDDVSGSSPNVLWRVTDSFQGFLIRQETFGAAATSTYNYDAQRHWLDNVQTSLAGEQIQSIGYTHYKNGLVHTASVAGEPSREYLYDQLNRLRFTTDTPVQGPGVSVPYSYDSIGNLVGRGATVTVPRSGQPHLIDHVGGNAYSYDANGNVSSRTGPDVPHYSQTIDYTPFNLPKLIVSGASDPGSSNPTGSSVRFEYSADQQRIIRRDEDSARYFVGDLYQRKADTSGTTLEERFQLYAGSRPIGEIVRKDGSDKTLFFHTDHLGSPETISDSDGGAYHERFEPFGMPAGPPNPELTRVGFTGQQHDNDLDLIDMKGRVYDPLAGRFASPDPITQAPHWSQGLNRYSYVFNNPVNNTDPSGFISFVPDFGPGNWGGVGMRISGSWSGVLQGAGAAAGNVATSLINGGYGGGVKARGTYDAAQSTAQAGNGVSSESPPAMTQNKGGPSELARPPGTSLFDPTRGALAQNFQPGGYCHEDGPCHDSIYIPDISGGDFARAETAIVEAFQRLWRWLTPSAGGGWQRFLPEAAKRLDAAKAKYGAEGVLNMAKKVDIKQIDRIVREVGLSPGQREIFHEEMRALKGADGLGAFDDLLDLAREIKQSFPGK